MSPYDAKHILCPGEIPATCPYCGVQHLNESVLRRLAERYPKGQTEGWNFHLKGTLPCNRCEAAHRG